jgi:hypothetical protein
MKIRRSVSGYLREGEMRSWLDEMMDDHMQHLSIALRL